MIWRRELPNAAEFDYPMFIAQMEEMSRAEFVTILEQQGLKRKAVALPANPATSAFGASGELPVEIAKQLNEMSFTSQFAALRSLHRLRGSARDERARLAGLARGYANLGVMCEYFWNPMHQVFKARALLYAERLVVADHRSSLALAYRAYVRAMVGFHGAALEDLAATQINAAARKAELPKWADLIADFCMFDSQAVKIFSDPSQQQLAALLRVVMAEQSDSPGLTPKVAAPIGQRAGMLSDLRRLRDPEILSASRRTRSAARQRQPDGGSNYRSRLTAIADLPSEVSKVIHRDANETPARRRKITQSLLDVQPATPADVADEMPWALMGRMLREISFYQAWRQMRRRAKRPAPDRSKIFLRCMPTIPTPASCGWRKPIRQKAARRFVLC